MKQQTVRRSGPGALRAALAFLLAVCLCAGLLPPVPVRAAEPVSFFQPELDKLVNWGVMQGYPDGSLGADNPITRAEFVALVNRAYGFTEESVTPFTDVNPNAWYSGDIGIAYNAGYYLGSTQTTASPASYLTREQALVLLARNMRLPTTPGEVTEFSDGRDFDDWSRNYVHSAVEKGIITGYDDGSFRPKNTITRGEMAAMLARSLGTLVSDSGVTSLGEVFGNVTLSRPDTTLMDTTVAGDLYISGGLGLGSMTLENVDVLGEIVIAGGGESNAGESVILRNTTADNLRVDSLGNDYLSLRAEGDTLIPQTNVRSDAYIMDNTPNGSGLQNISLDDGTRFSVAGNVENLVNNVPASELKVGAGAVQDLTVGETAVGSNVIVDQGATVRNMNLDTATPVTGQGDVSKMNVNTEGSSSQMLPDKVDIRPGVTANVAGTNMTKAMADEVAEEPRLLSGYPKVNNIAPTSARAVFAVNKAGTVYWAVSAVSDGSASETDLLTPPVYGTRILKHGNVKTPLSTTEYNAAISGLTAGSNYYLTTMMVDEQGNRSPLKVAAFSTPDNSVPGFSGGTPLISRNTYDATSGVYEVQAQIIPTKSCKLHWALYYAGTTTPTVAEFRANSLPGALAFSTMDVVRNQEEYLRIHNFYNLQELTSYSLFLWLNDVDSGQSSRVVKVDFTTVDGTPPVFQVRPTATRINNTSVTMLANLNEDGTVYWAAVLSGTDYPKAPIGGGPLTTEYAVSQVINGMNCIKSGKANARANRDVTFTISGLQAETTYDIWYVGVDKAGNHSAFAVTGADRNAVVISTLDTSRPSATQEFTKFDAADPDRPYADTDVRIVFNERVQHTPDRDPDLNLAQPLELYNTWIDVTRTQTDRNEARRKLAKVLKSMIQLYDAETVGRSQSLAERTEDSQVTDWYIDYRNAIVTMEDRKMVVTFPTTDDSLRDSALQLRSGSGYYFQISNVCDTSAAQNVMGTTRLPNFETISAQVQLKTLNATSASWVTTDDVVLDIAFALTPLSTNVDDSVDLDMLLLTDSSVSMQLYTLEPRSSGGYSAHPVTTDFGTTATDVEIINDSGKSFIGRSLYRDFMGRAINPHLRDELSDNKSILYGIHFTSINHVAEAAGRGKAWDGEVNLRVSVVTGTSRNLGNLSTNITAARITAAKAAKNIEEIHSPNPFELTASFSNQSAPSFEGNYPAFAPLDTSVTMYVTLDRPGTLYYVIAPASSNATVDGETTTTYELTIPTRMYNGSAPSVELETDPNAQYPERHVFALSNTGRVYVPTVGKNPRNEFETETPTNNLIYSPRFGSNRIQTGNIDVGTGVTEIYVNNLEPATLYLAYFVVQGTGQVYSAHPMLYQFTTQEVNRPYLEVARSTTSSVNITSRNMNAIVDYALFHLAQISTTLFWEEFNDASKLISGAYPLPESAKIEDTDGTRRYPRIYEAMQTITTGGTSLFDLYANEATKRRVANLIASEATSGARFAGRTQRAINQNTTTTVDCVKDFKIPEINQYFFAVAGWYNDPNSKDKSSKNIRADSISFRGVSPIYQADTTPPKIDSINGSMVVDYTNLSADGKPTISGEIYMTFDKTLYYFNSETDRPMISLESAVVPGSGYKSVTSLANTTLSGFQFVTDDSVKTTNTIILTMDDTYGNIYISRNLCTESSRPLSSDLGLQIELPKETGTPTVRTQFPAGIWLNKENININVTVIPRPATGVTLDRQHVEMQVGDTVNLTATLYPIGSVGRLEWDASSTAVEPVKINDATVQVTAKRTTTTDVTVTVYLVDNEDKNNVFDSAECKIAVSPVKVTEIILDTRYVAFDATGGQKSVQVSVGPLEAEEKRIRFSASSEKKISIEQSPPYPSENGMYTLNITRHKDNEYSARDETITVTVSSWDQSVSTYFDVFLPANPNPVP